MSIECSNPCTAAEPPISLPERLLILAGRGDYPRLAAEGARRAGVSSIFAIGFSGSIDRKLRDFVDGMTLIPFGRFSRVLSAAGQSGCTAAIMAGQISPVSLFSSAFDLESLKLLRELRVHNAHTIFGRAVEKLGSEYGIKVFPASYFMKDHIPDAGVLTKTAPDGRISSDIDFGNRICRAVCDLDIGQTVVVKDGTVIAVEGIDGTNSTIRRVRRICGKGAVVVKTAKNGHDMRFDIPVVGMRTVQVMKRAGISALSVQAWRTIVLDLPAVAAAADKCGISVVAVDSGLPKAPVFGG